jgi:hypothetical protein
MMTGPDDDPDQNGVRGYVSCLGSQWQLRTATNLDHLEARIKAAMGSGEALDIEIEGRTEGARSARVVINGRALPFVELWNEDQPRDTD